MSKQDFRQIYFYKFKLGRSAGQITRNINKVWDKGSINVSAVQRWFQKFHRGYFDLQDKSGHRRPSVVDNDQLKAIVEVDPTKTTREVANELVLVGLTK